jgi:hypothetical protein
VTGRVVAITIGLAGAGALFVASLQRSQSA